MTVDANPVAQRARSDHWPWVAAGLGILVMATSFGVIYAAHTARDLFRDLEQERRAENEIQNTWRQLLLERGTLASHGRVETIARERLRMGPVDGELHVLVAE